eukprot:6193364-Pleurochrysis_carterae.AAC.1
MHAAAVPAARLAMRTVQHLLPHLFRGYCCGQNVGGARALHTSVASQHGAVCGEECWESLSWATGHHARLLAPPVPVSECPHWMPQARHHCRQHVQRRW